MTATETSATVRPPRQRAAPSTPAISEKAQARMIRQKILEHEQHAEELEALQVTPEELKTLRESFAAVKADFVDLDGQSWETPAAREMLVNWHAERATRERPVPLSPGGLRVRHQRPRRSLAAVVSPTSALSHLPPAEDEDVFSDQTVRAKPASAPPVAFATDGAPEVLRMRREGTRTVDLPTVYDDEDPNDITLMAPPGLLDPSPSRSQTDFAQQPPAAGRRKSLSDHVMSASPSAPVFSLVGRAAVAPASACAPTVLSNSPTLNQSPTSSKPLDDATVRAGPVPKRRVGCSSVVAPGRMHMHPDDVETVMHEFFPGAVGAAPPHDGGLGPGTSHQATATPSSSGFARSPSVGGWQGRARSRSSASDEGVGRRHALLRSKAAAPAHADVDGDGHERGVVRSTSRVGRSPAPSS